MGQEPAPRASCEERLARGRTSNMSSPPLQADEGQRRVPRVKQLLVERVNALGHRWVQQTSAFQEWEGVLVARAPNHCVHLERKLRPRVAKGNDHEHLKFSGGANDREAPLGSCPTGGNRLLTPGTIAIIPKTRERLTSYCNHSRMRGTNISYVPQPSPRRRSESLCAPAGRISTRRWAASS